MEIAAAWLSSNSAPSFSICTPRSSIRSGSRRIVQSRAIVGLAAVDQSHLRVLVCVRHLARGPVVVIAQILEMSADLVRHLERGQCRVEREEAAVITWNVQAGIALIDGAKEATEVLPDGLRVVGIAVLKSALEGFSGQQTPVLAKGAEQNAVQQLLGLVHGGHAPIRKRPVQRITTALSFEHRDELFLVLLEPA